MELASNRPHVVVVGGGFGGLHAARGLRHAPVRVTLVDRSNHHLFQPLLYQVATAALSAGDIAAPIRTLVRGQDARVLLAEAVGVDLAGHRLLLEEEALPYDYLVLAAGTRDHYFGHPEWARYAVGLKTLDDALEIRRRIFLAYERAERERNSETREQWMTFVLIGGGATGVEMAGALAEIARQVLVHDFWNINPEETRIVLVEGAPRVLPSYPEALSEKGRRALERLGVEVRAHARVTHVDERGVWIGEELIPTRTVMWSAGVAAAALSESLNVPLDRTGKVIVTSELALPGHPNVFVVGDLAAVTSEGERVPGVAPAAMQEGTHAARNICRNLQGKPPLPFRYWDRGTFAVVGRGSAVGILFRRLRVSGVVAWLTWLFIHILFLVGFRNRLAVLFNWAYAYLLFRRGARVIYGRASDGSRKESSAPTVRR